MYAVAALAVAFNGFSLDVWQAVGGASDAPGGLGDVSAGVLADVPPVVLIGSFGLVPAGFARGCFFAARIVLLVTASLVVTYTTTSTQLTDALCAFMRPLRRLRVPVDDAAMVFSLALRFIPVTAEELARVRDAQWARGAAFAEGRPVERAWARGRPRSSPCSWGCSVGPMRWPMAMDARCYGHARRGAHRSFGAPTA